MSPLAFDAECSLTDFRFPDLSGSSLLIVDYAVQLNQRSMSELQEMCDGYEGERSE